MDRDRRISRGGTARARKTLIQFAWLWLRYHQDSSLACWFRESVGNLQERTRRIANGAMARKLLIAIWRNATDGILGGGTNLDLIRNRRHNAGGCPGRCDRLRHCELTLPAFRVGHIQPGSTPRA